MDAIPEKIEVKSDFDFDYCSKFGCLVDKKYCEFCCETIQRTKLKNQNLSYDELVCLWRWPEDDYLARRKLRR